MQLDYNSSQAIYTMAPKDRYIWLYHIYKHHNFENRRLKRWNLAFLLTMALLAVFTRPWCAVLKLTLIDSLYVWLVFLWAWTAGCCGGCSCCCNAILYSSIFFLVRNLALYFKFRGLVLNLYPQHGHHNPSHFKKISHTWHRFCPVE